MFEYENINLVMKPVFTSEKEKTKIKLSGINLNLERGEQIIVSSLSDLKRKENLEKLKISFSRIFYECRRIWWLLSF